MTGYRFYEEFSDARKRNGLNTVVAALLESRHPDGSVDAAAISKSLDAQRRVTKTVNLCVAEVDDNGGLMTCGLPADDNIHHMSSVDGYYEFQPGKSAAPPVAEKSSTNGRSGLTGFTRKSDSI